MHVKVLLFKGLERYINLYMYSLLHVLLSILIGTIYCYIILYLVYVPRTNFKNGTTVLSSGGYQIQVHV